MNNFEVDSNGVITRNYQQVGYIENDVIYSGGSYGSKYGGTQVGYIQGDAIFAGGSYGGTYGGTQVGYVQSGEVYSGGSYGGTYGGQRVGQAATAHPRWHAAAFFLLT